MARLIDADALMDEMHYYDEKQKTDVWTTSDVEILLKELPTVDAVEVVRCENCKWHEPCKPYNKVWCPKIGRYMNADAFCSEGVKKDA